MDLKGDGISSFILPVLVSKNGRIEDQQVKNVFRLLMVLGLMNPKFDLERAAQAKTIPQF